MACIVLVQRLLCVWLPTLMNSGLGPSLQLGDTVICLFLVAACSTFCSLGLDLMA